MAKRQNSTQKEESSASKKLKSCSNEPDGSIDTAEEATESVFPSLLDLSDDILLIILSKLHPIDIESLSKTSHRLNVICHDRTLWTDVDFRPYPLLAINLEKYNEFYLPTTKSISCCGPVESESNIGEYTMTRDVMTKIRLNASNLKKLILENQRINSKGLLLENFPDTLEHLELKNCIFENYPSQQSYFYDVKINLPNLKVLDLTGNKWFLPHSLIALSKSTTIRKLVLAECTNMIDCVPYASLSACYGFRSLEVLDLRGTPVEDSDVTCFNRVATLKELYLEAPTEEGGDQLITDLAITAFGGVRAPLQQHAQHAHAENEVDLRRIRMGVLLVQGYPWRVDHPSLLTTLIVRNYRAVTDISLKHAVSCLPNLRHFDIRGTGCTEAGVSLFRQRRTDVTLHTDFVTLDTNR